MLKFKVNVYICLSFLLIVLLSACSTLPVKHVAEPARLTWPPAPMEAKIEWVKEYKILQETVAGKGFFAKVRDFFIGPKSANLVRPYGVCTDNKDQLFIADTGGSKIHIFDMQNGNYRSIEGSGDSRLKAPIGVVHVDGYLYITDSLQKQVFEYDLNKNILKPWSPYLLQRPTGITFDEATHSFYISDTLVHQIVVFDQNGVEQFRFGGRGVAAGEFNFPTDIWIGTESRVYVTDSLNARIQIFSAAGDYISQFGQPGDTPGSFSKPKGVAVDQYGHIFVCDALFDAVQIFDEIGRVLLSFGENGISPGQFWMPSGIFIDKQSNIYVADTYNQRIQVFRILTK